MPHHAPGWSLCPASAVHAREPTWAGAAGENTRSFRPGRRLPTDHGGQGRPSSCSSTGAEGTPGGTVAESGAGSGRCPPRSACCQQPGRRSQLRGWRGSAGLAAGSPCPAAAVGVPHQKGKREKRRLHLPGPSGAGFNPDSSGSAARMVQGPELLPVAASAVVPALSPGPAKVKPSWACPTHSSFPEGSTHPLWAF